MARQDALVDAAVAAAEPEQRTPARIDLARFYMSRGMYPEAKGVLDLALADAKPGAEDPVALIVHSVASILMGRPEQGAERPRQSGDRNQLRFPALEGAGLCAAGQMGRGAGEIQERRIRHHLAADRSAAHRDRRRRCAPRSRSRIIPAPRAQQRSRCHRHSATR